MVQTSSELSKQYTNTKAKMISPDGETKQFHITVVASSLLCTEPCYIRSCGNCKPIKSTDLIAILSRFVFDYAIKRAM